VPIQPEHFNRIVTQIEETILDSASASLKESPHGKKLGWDMKTSVDRKEPGQLTGKRSNCPRGLLRKQSQPFRSESFSPKRENPVKNLRINWLQPASPISFGVAISGIPPKIPCQRVPRPGLIITSPRKIRCFPELRLRSGGAGWNDSLAGFSPNNGPCRFLNESREIRPDAIGDPKHQFHCRIPKTSFDQTEHGFRHPRTLGNGVIREMSAFPLLFQEPNDFLSDCLIMSNSRHAALWQKTALDIYIAMVKYRGVIKLMNRAFLAHKLFPDLKETQFFQNWNVTNIDFNARSERFEPTITTEQGYANENH
jgi:hypothetical protein